MKNVTRQNWNLVEIIATNDSSDIFLLVGKMLETERGVTRNFHRSSERLAIVRRLMPRSYSDCSLFENENNDAHNSLLNALLRGTLV